jgi:hypothetical protein
VDYGFVTLHKAVAGNQVYIPTSAKFQIVDEAATVLLPAQVLIQGNATRFS